MYNKAEKILGLAAVIEAETGPRKSEDKKVQEEVRKSKDEIEELITDIEKVVRKEFNLTL